MQKIEGISLLLRDYLEHQEEYKINGGWLPLRNYNAGPFIQKLIRKDHIVNNEIPRRQVQEGNNLKEERSYCFSKLSAWAIQVRQEDPP